MKGMIEFMDGWSRLRRICQCVVFSVCLVVGTTLAIAQQDQQVPMTSKPAQGEISAWVKICTKNEQNRQVCLVKYEALDPKTGGVLVVVAVRTTEGKDKQDFLIHVPTAYSLVIPAGVRIKIDEDEPISLQYALCLPTNCQVHTELAKQIFARMRTGKQMLVAAINMQQKALTFWVPLNGFGKAFDGAPVDTAKYQETRARMMDFAKKAAKDQQKAQQAKGQEKSPSQAIGSNVTTAPAKTNSAQSP